MKDSIRFTSNLNSCIESSYKDSLEDFRDYIKVDFSKILLTDDFHETFYNIIFSSPMENYSPLKYYWLKNVEDFFYILELHYDKQDKNLSDGEEFTDKERESEIGDSWFKTPFANAFETMREEGLNVNDSSMALITLMESQILSFYYLHFLDAEIQCETAFLYNATPELGDFETRVYLSDENNFINFESMPELFPSIPVSEVDHDSMSVSIDINKESSSYDIYENESFISISDMKFPFLASYDVEQEEFEILKKTVEMALNGCDKSLIESTLSVIVANKEITSMNAFLPGYLNLNIEKFSSDSIKAVIASYVSEVIDETIGYTSEEIEDDSGDAFFSAAKDYVELSISKKITEEQENKFLELYESSLEEDIVSDAFTALMES